MCTSGKIFSLFSGRGTRLPVLFVVLTISFVTFWGGSGKGQAPVNIDSLEAAIPKIKDLREKWEANYTLAMAKRNSSPRDVFFIGKDLLDIAREMENDSLIANSYSLMGTAKTVLDEYNDAVTHFTEGIRYAKRSKFKSVERTIHLNLGTVFFKMGDNIQGKNQLKKAYDLLDPDAPPSSQEHILNNLGVAYEIENKLDSALLMLQMAAQLMADDDSGRIAINNVNQAMVYVKMGEPSMAHNLNLKAIQLLRETPFSDRKVTAFIGAMGTSISLGDPQMARVYLDSAKFNAHQDGSPNEIQSVLEAESEYFERTGRFEEALEAHQRYVDFKDSVSIAMQEGRMGELRAELNQVELEASAELYKAESEVERQKRLRQNTWLWGFGIGLGAVLVGAIFLIIAFVTRSRSNRRLVEKNAVITEQNELLKQQKETLKDLNREKEGLIGVVAHDLKSPLNKSLALINLIESAGPLNSNQAKAVEMIRQSNQDGTELIRDLLELNSVELDERSLIASTVNSRLFLQGLFDGFQPEAQRKSIGLEVIAPGPSFDFQTHQLSLRRIMENLVSNALKFSPSNTTIQLGIQKQNGTTTLFVQDEGPGISMTDQQNLFKKFQRLTAQPTGGESSTGLGLAITKSLVEKLGGTIEVESELGKGTRFTVQLD